MIIRLADAQNSIEAITRALREKKIVALPTDTIYGLAVDGTDEDAVRKLRALKQREAKPFTFFMNRGDIERHAVPAKKKIIDFFMPGPLTVILKTRPGVALPFVGEKIGLRIPQHNFVQQLLAAYQKPLAVTSANISGQAHCASAPEISAQFGAVSLVVDGGALHNAPSTVLDATVTPPAIRRKGAIPLLALERVYGRKVALDAAVKFNVLFVCSGNTCRSPMAEAILRTLVRPEHAAIRSAGTSAIEGLPAGTNAQQVVREHGGSVERHKTALLDRAAIEWADLILVMEYKHYETTLQIDPEAVVKTFLLREFGRKTKYTAVPDPVGQGIDAYRQAALSMLPTLKAVARDIEMRFKKAS